MEESYVRLLVFFNSFSKHRRFWVVILVNENHGKYESSTSTEFSNKTSWPATNVMKYLSINAYILPCLLNKGNGNIYGCGGNKKCILNKYAINRWAVGFYLSYNYVFMFNIFS